MALSYYDIDNILASSQKVPCTFKVTVPGIGHLQGSPGHKIEQGAKLELPMWLASILLQSQPSDNLDAFTVGKPACLDTPIRNDLKADPRMVDLRALNPNFFAFGALNLELWPDDEELMDVLLESFKKRAREIGDQAPNSSSSKSSEMVDFKLRLDEDERQLYQMAHDGTNAVKNWMRDLNKT